MKEGYKPLLADKKVILFNTHGQPTHVYEQGFYKSMNLIGHTGIYNFWGMQVIEHWYYDSVPYTTD